MNPIVHQTALDGLQKHIQSQLWIALQAACFHLACEGAAHAEQCRPLGVPHGLQRFVDRFPGDRKGVIGHVGAIAVDRCQKAVMIEEMGWTIAESRWPLDA